MPWSLSSSGAHDTLQHPHDSFSWDPYARDLWILPWRTHWQQQQLLQAPEQFLYACRMYGHAFEAFKTIVTDPDQVFNRLQDETNGGQPIEALNDAVKEGITKNVRRRMTPQPIKIRADVELTCFAYDGVLHIQVLWLSPI